MDTYSLCSLVKLTPHSDGNVPISRMPCKFLLRRRRRRTQFINDPLWYDSLFKFVLGLLKFGSSYNIHHLMPNNNDLYLAQPVSDIWST